jgi:dUTP pyrophosphatase
MSVRVGIRRLPGHDPEIPLPAYATAGAAGMDVRANFPADQRAGLTLQPMQRALIATGLSLAIPDGHEIQVRPRSGLALKHGLALVNAPGTIDSDYRGPLGILLVNLGDQPFAIAHGDRIAQLVLSPVTRCDWDELAELVASARGSGGFGSTGI